MTAEPDDQLIYARVYCSDEGKAVLRVVMKRDGIHKILEKTLDQRDCIALAIDANQATAMLIGAARPDQPEGAPDGSA